MDSQRELIIRKGQAQFKVKDYCALYGLEYTVTDKGNTKTLRTKENINGFMDGLKEVNQSVDISSRYKL